MANSPWGSRTKTQRRGTGGLPERYQTAVCEVSSTVRVAPLYQATAAVVQDRPGWSTSDFQRGQPSAFQRGPTVPARLTCWRRFIEGGVQAQAGR